MKKQSFGKKLQLKKVILSSLDNEAQSAIQGGATMLHCAQPTTTVQHTYICVTIGVTCIDCEPTLSGCQTVNICNQ